MRIAVVPARGGSKRIPGKNIRLFHGKPIIAWSIEAALTSGCFDKVIVTTDDARIAEVANQFGAETPFVRPPELSDDHTGTIPVIKHAIEWLIANGQPPQHVCCVYATAPFLRAEDIQRGFAQLVESSASFAFSVTSYGFPIQRALKINQNQRVEMFNPEHFATRSQDLEEAFHDAGQFYWGTADAWRSETVIFSPMSTPVLLPRYRVQDIDTEEDWKRAELMFGAIGNVQ